MTTTRQAGELAALRRLGLNKQANIVPPPASSAELGQIYAALQDRLGAAADFALVNPKVKARHLEEIVRDLFPQHRQEAVLMHAMDAPAFASGIR